MLLESITTVMNNGAGISRMQPDIGIPISPMAKIYTVMHCKMPWRNCSASTTMMKWLKNLPQLQIHREMSLLTVLLEAKHQRFDRCYGGSESNDFRVACAVAQTNIGHQYVDRTLEALGIEPGRNCTGHNLKMDRKRCHDSIRKSNNKFKKRRNQLHSRRISNTARKEKQEGTTYQTNVGLIQGMNVTSPHESTTEDVHGLSDISEETLMMYESTVSPFTSRPACTNVAYDQNTFYNFVIFDLETNTTGRAAEICQLSAVDQSGRSSFSEYALPVKQIDKYASKVNKLSVKIVNGQRTLFKETQQLVTLNLDELLSRFTRFLESLINCYQRLTDQNICTVLLGHNTKRFDIPVLLGHNTKRFDIPVLLRNSTNSFKEKLTIH